MQNTVSPISSIPPSLSSQPPSPKKKNPATLVAIVIVAVIVLFGLFFMFSRRNQITNKQETSISPTVTPEPTTAKAVDKTTVKIQVLNGTGTPGQAGSAVTLLTDAGYSKDNIKTDNAPDDNNPKTTISAKEGFEETAKDIASALKDKFPDASIDSTALGSESDFDVVVTTGGKKFEAPTSTPAPTSEVSGTPTPSTTITPTKTPTPTP